MEVSLLTFVYSKYLLQSDKTFGSLKILGSSNTLGWDQIFLDHKPQWTNQINLVHLSSRKKKREDLFRRLIDGSSGDEFAL